MLSTSKTHAVINDNETPLSQFVLDSNFTYNTSLTSNLIKNSLEINQINATELSKYLFGNTILSNIFLVGYAIQKGLIPISIDALEKVQINNVSMEENLSALIGEDLR